MSRSFGKLFRSKPVVVLSCVLIIAIALSFVMITRATTPNPGHPWTDIGNGNFAVANTQTATRTYNFPDMNTKMLTGSSSLTFVQRTIITNTTLSTSTDAFVYVDASSSPITVTLPLSTTTSETGLFYFIRKLDSSSNLVTITASGADKIDTITSITLANRGEGVMLQSDGTTWRVVLRRDYDIDGYRTRGTSAATNQWYTSPANGTTLSTAALTANKIYATPIIFAKISTFDQMGIKVTVASGTAEVGLYNDNGNLYPGTLAVDCGSFNTANAVAVSSTCTTTVDAGLYWMVIVPSNALTVQGIAVGGIMPVLGYSSTLGTGAQVGWTATLTKGALPATFPSAGSSTISATAIPAVYIRLTQ